MHFRRSREGSNYGELTAKISKKLAKITILLTKHRSKSVAKERKVIIGMPL